MSSARRALRNPGIQFVTWNAHGAADPNGWYLARRHQGVGCRSADAEKVSYLTDAEKPSSRRLGGSVCHSLMYSGRWSWRKADSVNLRYLRCLSLIGA